MLVAPKLCQPPIGCCKPKASLLRQVCAGQRHAPKCSAAFRKPGHQKKHTHVALAVSANEVGVDEEPVQEQDVEERAIEIVPDIYCITGTCSKRFKFAVQYGLKRGTTDNAYLIKGNTRDTTALIDVPSEEFANDFVAALENMDAFGSIGHIVMTHVDKKSVRTLEIVIEKILMSGATQVEIHLLFPALNFLRNIMGETDGGKQLLEVCLFTVMNPGSVLDLGEGRQLEFIKISTPRWPDMLAVYLKSSNVLFSSKYFSCHVAPEVAGATGPYDMNGWGEYGEDWKFYFDCMLLPTANQVQKGMNNLNIAAAPVGQTGSQSLWRLIVGLFRRSRPGLSKSASKQPVRLVSYLCPMHGPVIKNAANELVEEYNEWLVDQGQIKSKVAVLYASAYGHTATLAQAISRGVSKAGVAVETVNLEIAEPSDITQALKNSSGFVIGSPTLGGHMPTQVQSALGAILRDSSAKLMPCGVFGSFGWSGEAVDEMNQRLRDGGFSFAFEPIKVKFRPSSKDVQVCEESGTDLAQQLVKNEKLKKRQTAEASKARGASEAAQAIGRVVGSLCVLTAKDGENEGGMLASWISQASFDPPGITIAVKNDRAMEYLMVQGNKFNVNILAQGREKPMVKAMLKPFKPGEDRFTEMEVERSEATGCIILPDAVAYLECTIEERMEAGDHWVVFATVQDGKLQDKSGFSAVHHRKVGTTY